LNSLVGVPLFVAVPNGKIGSGDFHLQHGSPAIGKGTNLSTLFSTDFSGLSRAKTGPWDVGAFAATAAVVLTGGAAIMAGITSVAVPGPTPGLATGDPIALDSAPSIKVPESAPITVAANPAPTNPATAAFKGDPRLMGGITSANVPLTT
jgi:hypothetical protein